MDRSPLIERLRADRESIRAALIDPRQRDSTRAPRGVSAQWVVDLLLAAIDPRPLRRPRQGDRHQAPAPHVVAAVECAQRGAPLQPLLREVELASARLIAECVRRARPDERIHVANLTREVSATADRLTADVGTAYAMERGEATTGRSARPALAMSILGGSLPPDLARRAGHRVASRYSVLVASSRAADDDLFATRADAALREGDLGLSVVVDGALHVVVDASALDGGYAAALAVVERLRAFDVAIELPAVLVVAGTPSDVPAANPRALELVGVARASRTTDRVVRGEHLALERRLASDPTLVDEVLVPLAPLRGVPKLLETLEVLYRFDLNRSRTASHLKIVRRTLAYRLNRVRELTGLDPLSVRGIRLLSLALASLGTERKRTGGQTVDTVPRLA
ncbi:PucR family transcriptional regulator [Actinokineospora guangxiensis]|uniref:PucR family transcriptional regulator n=1 Tax=Actinokineospora guangxiensis TaxID=1490288 RepID=A0ABW0EVH1_9PSEU